MKVFFDLDPAVYMSAFAAQSRVYFMVYVLDDELQQGCWEDGRKKEQFKRDMLKAENDFDIVEEWSELVVEEESHARQCAKTLVTRALAYLKRKFKQPLEVSYFLTGSGNFREEVATIAKYKGNRDEMEKPVHYQAVRDYYVKEWGAEVVEGIEADDEVSIRAWELFRNTPEEYVVATIDKDLDQIPGLHYDYQKHVIYDVDALDGELFFWAQVLSGDATDNIKGCYRIGIAKAKKLVDEWFDEYADLTDDGRLGTASYSKYIWEKIVGTYEVNMNQYPDKHEHDLTPAAAAMENATLVYMQQRRGEVWEPPNA